MGRWTVRLRRGCRGITTEYVAHHPDRFSSNPEEGAFPPGVDCCSNSLFRIAKKHGYAVRCVHSQKQPWNRRDDGVRFAGLSRGIKDFHSIAVHLAREENARGVYIKPVRDGNEIRTSLPLGISLGMRGTSAAVLQGKCRHSSDALGSAKYERGLAAIRRYAEFAGQNFSPGMRSAQLTSPASRRARASGRCRRLRVFQVRCVRSGTAWCEIHPIG